MAANSHSAMSIPGWPTIGDVRFPYPFRWLMELIGRQMKRLQPILAICCQTMEKCSGVSPQSSGRDQQALSTFWSR